MLVIFVYVPTFQKDTAYACNAVSKKQKKNYSLLGYLRWVATARCKVILGYFSDYHLCSAVCRKQGLYLV